MYNITPVYTNDTTYTNRFLGNNHTHYADGVPLSGYANCFKQGRQLKSFLIIGYVNENYTRPRAKQPSSQWNNKIFDMNNNVLSLIDHYFSAASTVCSIIGKRCCKAAPCYTNACQVSSNTGIHPFIIALMDIQIFKMGIQNYAYFALLEHSPKMIIVATVPWNTNNESDNYKKAIDEIEDLGTQNNAQWVDPNSQYGKYLGEATISICILSLRTVNSNGNDDSVPPQLECKMHNVFTVKKRNHGSPNNFSSLCTLLMKFKEQPR